ncbi:MAG: helix-turn-helix transcriptional regulator [Tissierellia bacterium]|nr:helix-turn-helix transcriptional regulator [Tissierellia bacterium]
MRKRIKELRKILNLSQASFGDRLGVSRDMIANVEYGRSDIKEFIIKSICREFNVNEHWLRTGEGEMFDSSKDSLVDSLSKEYELSSFETTMLDSFLKLSPEKRKVISDYLKSLNS